MSFEVLILVKFSFFVNKFKFIAILGFCSEFTNFNKSNLANQHEKDSAARKRDKNSLEFAKFKIHF